MFEKVLVAIDGSKYAHRALEAGASIARQSKGEVRVVHAREVAAPVPSIETRGEAAALVDSAVAELQEEKTTVSGVLRDAKVGHIATEIVTEAHDWDADVIVLASRGLSDLAGLVLGSTTHKVLHLSDVPVLVVR